MREAFLILEDDTYLHDLYKAYFKERDLYIFEDLNPALDFINSDDFDKIALAILDINVNSTLKIGGFNAAYQIKRIRPEIPIVICSAYKKDDYVTKLSKMIGAYVYEKPFELEGLIQKISEILGEDMSMPITELDNLFKTFMSSAIHFKLNMLIEYNTSEQTDEILDIVDEIEQELMENYSFMVEQCEGEGRSKVIETKYNFYKTFKNELVDYIRSLVEVVQHTVMSQINLTIEEENFVDEINEISDALLQELDKL